MSEALLGVAIGGGIAVLAALISSIVGPAMTARYLRANARAERLHLALRELDDATDYWFLIGSDVEDHIARDAEGRVLVALRRLNSASSGRLLHLAVAKAMDDLNGSYAVIGPASYRERMVDAARSDFMDSADLVVQIAADIADPPQLPVRLHRWTVRAPLLRTWWRAQRRIARLGGA